MSEETRDMIWYIVVAGVSREKSLLTKRMCINHEWLNNELEANFSFCGPWDSMGNEKYRGSSNRAVAACKGQ